MASSPPVCRAVLDSNVLIAARRSTHSHSPNRELIDRWQANEFTLLFSRDTLYEYVEKLLALSPDRADAVDFSALISAFLADHAYMAPSRTPNGRSLGERKDFYRTARRHLNDQLVARQQAHSYGCLVSDG